MRPRPQRGQGWRKGVMISSNLPWFCPSPPLLGDTPIRAFCGLRLPLFPEPEGIIPENGGIIWEKFLFLRRRGEVIFSHVLWAERRVKRISVACREFGCDREALTPL
jgi:hypothetical protein